MPVIALEIPSISFVLTAVFVTPAATPLTLTPDAAVSSATDLIIIWTMPAEIDIKGAIGSGLTPWWLVRIVIDGDLSSCASYKNGTLSDVICNTDLTLTVMVLSKSNISHL